MRDTPPSSVDLVGVGEMMLLLQPPAGDRIIDAVALEVQVAGAEFNACAALVALGGSAAVTTKLGTGPLGDRVRAAGEQAGVHVNAVEDERRPTGVFFKDPDASGARRVYYYRAGSAASTLDAHDAPRIYALRPRAILLSGLTAALGPGPEALVRTLAEGARDAGALVVVDANLRPSLGRLEEAAETLRAVLSFTDILIVGTDEALPIFGTEDPAEIARRAGTAGCRETVVKAGADGCYWIDESGTAVHVPSQATEIIDPVGAGDAFAGAYVQCRLLDMTSEDSAIFASRFAAVIVATSGDVAAPGDRAVAGLRAELGERVRR